MLEIPFIVGHCAYEHPHRRHRCDEQRRREQQAAHGPTRRRSIGVGSYFSRNGTLEQLRGMLRLKVLWSLTAILGLALSIREGAPPMAWVFQAIFLGFSALWCVYAVRLRR